jgi:predicted nucleic acid-binding protein
VKNLVDSSGWVEYFTAGANAHFFTPPIQAVDNLIVPTICIYEVFKRLLLDLGEESALQGVGVMSLGQEVELNRTIALEAARISVEHKLAMADSLILATARTYNATLWTQDKHFKTTAGVNYFEKPQA